MPSPAARTADDIGDNIKTLIDRMVDAKVTHEMAKRGQDVAEFVGDRSNEAWKETRPMRRYAIKRLSRATHDAAKWSDRTWRKSLRPFFKDVWKQRAVAAGAAGAAVPAAQELVDTAAVRLGLKKQEERHWGAFFLGLLVGAAAGAIVAMLTTPKRGEEMRQELGARADEFATKARDEWVPLFQSDATNGHPDGTTGAVADTTASIEEAAAEAGAASGEATDQAATDTAEAINEAYDSVDREAT